VNVPFSITDICTDVTACDDADAAEALNKVPPLSARNHFTQGMRDTPPISL
jgi:hypothetical protein